MQAMYPNLKKANVELIAVNQGDDAETITDYITSEKFTFLVGMNGKDANDVPKHYGVMAYPTNYVINKDGVVVEAVLGFDEKRLKEALKKIGVVFN